MTTIKSYSVGKGFASADSLRALQKAKNVAKTNKQVQPVTINGRPYAYVSPSGRVTFAI